MPTVDGLLPVFAALGGIVLGLLLRQVVAATSIRTATSRAQGILEEARQQQISMVIAAKGDISRLRAEADGVARNEREALAAESERVRLREIAHEERETFFVQREASIAERERASFEEAAVLAAAKASVASRLAEVAGLDPEAARTEVLARITVDAESEAGRLQAALERRAEESAADRARDMILTAMQRVAADHSAEHAVTHIKLPSEEMKGRLIGREGRNIRAIEHATGVELLVDETPMQVTLSSFDPVRRQVARITIERLMQDGRIHPVRIEEIVQKVQGEVDQAALKNGEGAALEVGVTGISTELLRILGRLEWRTSYGQNVLQHSVETAQVAGAIAGELGMDIRAAKVGGLLHDVGKALSHEIEGTHAAIGADLARRHGMPEAIVNAIAAHHQEVECTAREAPIVQVADAISAARPGARGDQAESHLRRLEDLQNIAMSFEGVEKVYAVQAGREVRILVRPEQVDDATARTIARDVVKRIEEQLSYPGQIRVTVIRETRAVDYAR
jgi:ribonuclease Y